MIENLVKQFLGSGAAGEAVSALQTQQGMSEEQAKGAVGATAEGAAQALAGGGGADLGSMLGGLASGGGLGGLAGALTGGGGAAGAISPQLIDTVAGVVAQKTGIEAGTAKTVVSLVLPKVLEFAKAQMGGGGGQAGGGAGGLLGGLLG